MNTDKKPGVSQAFLEMLLRGMNHDFSASIRHITFFSQMLLEKAPSSENTKQQEWLSHTATAGMEMQTMLEQITECVHILHEQNKLETFNLFDVYQDVVQVLKTQFKSNHENFFASKLNVVGEWPKNIHGVRKHWYRLFERLLNNAILYHPLDSTHVKCVNIALTASSNVLTIDVEDNGIGISDSNLQEFPKAFKRFNHKSEYDGIGMGLMHCWLIAELSDASISFAESDLGGLKVTYTCPLTTHTQ